MRAYLFDFSVFINVLLVVCFIDMSLVTLPQLDSQRNQPSIPVKGYIELQLSYFKVQCLLLCQQAETSKFSVSQFCQQAEVSKSKVKVHSSANRQKFQSSEFIVLPIGRSSKVQCSQLCQYADDSKFNVSYVQSYQMFDSSSMVLQFYSSNSRQRI